MARVRRVDGTAEIPFASSWQCAAAPAGAVSHPSELAAARLSWFPAPVPGTMASALAAAAAWDVDHPRDFDAEDWWLRCAYVASVGSHDRDPTLRLGGLATLADVWLDGQHLLRSENMFLEHEIGLGGRLRDGSELVLRFGALGQLNDAKRSRPRWRSTIVSRQQLRWVRTALLGRMLAFQPTAAHVGAYRPVTLRSGTKIAVDAELGARVAGADGSVPVSLRIRTLDGSSVTRVTVCIRGVTEELSVKTPSDSDGSVLATGVVTLPNIELWWPHTHGSPTLHAVHATVFTTCDEVAVSLGRTGFRSLVASRRGDGFGVLVNGIDVFCRGASWMPLDAVSLCADDAAYRVALEGVRDAGMNMLRVSGTTLYESQVFYDLCDELGLMVWQDFMFANMDYPSEDQPFCRSVLAEASGFLDRVQASPCLVVTCGNTEVAQQATMMGLAPSEASSRLFGDLLPALVRTMRPDVLYVETSPFGGEPPFRADTGVSHYYGVGAYRRPLEDARRSRVRFASECLAFANVPCDASIEELLEDGEAATTHPHWKSRVPRDRGASWDFEDVRDHYLQALFGVDPRSLRSTDLARYLELSRVTSGQVMADVMSEWRRTGSECRGALVWMLRDLWPGAGWGLVDALGRPKAAYYFLKRVLQPIAILVTDEGLNGLALHIINETAVARTCKVALSFFRLGGIPVADATVDVTVPARKAIALSDAAVLGRFIDATYAYRFGPRGHDLALATLMDRERGTVLSRAFHFSLAASGAAGDPALEAVAVARGSGEWRVTVRAARFAQFVALDAPGFEADDDFFHVEPRGERTITLRGTPRVLQARVKALNAEFSTKVLVER